jgi:hypothetical protein
MPKKWTEVLIAESIQKFYEKNNRAPVTKDFLKNKEYPSFVTVINYYGSWNNALLASNVGTNNYPDCTKEGIIAAIQLFYLENNVIPIKNDFLKNNKYPSSSSVITTFGSWNAAIEAAGLPIKNTSTYGVPTKALDKHLYRSKAEAYFVNNYLFNKYEYVIEPKYPNPHNKYYDWYISSLDLYIELDGELRPETIKEKVEINKQLNRNCLFIKTKDIYKGYTFEVFYTKSL